VKQHQIYPREGFEMKEVESPKFRDVSKEKWMSSKPFALRKSSLPDAPTPLSVAEPFTGPNKKKISPRKLVDDQLMLDTKNAQEMKRIDSLSNYKTGLSFFDQTKVRRVHPQQFFNLTRPEAPIFNRATGPNKVFGPRLMQSESLRKRRNLLD
jgi:hypothetical protein